MSLDHDKDSVMKSIELGACDYWIKPLCADKIKNMWTHVLRKFMTENKMQKDIISDNYKFCLSSNLEVLREVDNGGESQPSRKKSRIVWTSKLHGRFVKVINQIGLAGMIFQPLLYFSLFI